MGPAAPIDCRHADKAEMVERNACWEESTLVRPAIEQLAFGVEHVALIAVDDEHNVARGVILNCHARRLSKCVLDIGSIAAAPLLEFFLRRIPHDHGVATSVRDEHTAVPSDREAAGFVQPFNAISVDSDAVAGQSWFKAIHTNRVAVE